jgi:aminoglycoside phosphotransferase (APT) family kinase protein
MAGALPEGHEADRLAGARTVDHGGRRGDRHGWRAATGTRRAPIGCVSVPVFAYRRIPGVAADRSPVTDPGGLAADVGRMLDVLHRVDPDRIPSTRAGWEHLTLEYERTELKAHGGAAAQLLTPELAARAEPYLSGNLPEPVREAPRRFVHNDICPDHLIVDPRTGRLNGVIDFTDAMVGDPLLDFVGLVGPDQRDRPTPDPPDRLLAIRHERLARDIVGTAFTVAVATLVQREDPILLA